MDTGEFTKTMQRLSARYMEEYTGGMQRYADLLNNLAKPANGTSGRSITDSIEQQNRYTRFLLAETPKVLAQLTEASINYYTTVANLGMQTLNGYFDQVLQAQLSPTTAASKTAEPGGSALIFHGIRNQKAANAFLVSNHRNVPIDVAFDVTEIVSQDGSSRFTPKAVFTPKQCQLAPHCDKVVQCSFLLSKEFSAGQVYRGSISVVGFPEMAMPFSIEVEEAPAQEIQATTRKKPAARNKTKKKTVKK